MKIAIIKYNAGNVQSVLYAMQRLGVNASVTDDADEIIRADKVIFPGVGNAASAMAYLKDRHLDALIKSLQQPVLGICLGLQLMCNGSEEGNTRCLNIFDVPVRKFQAPANTGGAAPLKIPHMGWNTLYDLKSPLFEGVKQNEFVYFVHSYYAEMGKDTIAKTDYIVPFSAALQKGNFYGVQFHSEKSAGPGLQIIDNFINLA